jgi:hypothetical protein
MRGAKRRPASPIPARQSAATGRLGSYASTDDFAPRRPPVPGVNGLLTIIILIPLTKPPPGRR